MQVFHFADAKDHSEWFESVILIQQSAEYINEQQDQFTENQYRIACLDWLNQAELFCSVWGTVLVPLDIQYGINKNQKEMGLPVTNFSE